MAEELKPCPFCGAPGEIEHGSDHHGAWFNLGCSRHWGHVCDPDHSNTCIAGRVFYTETEVSEAEAIAAWNTRAAAAMSDLIAGDAGLYDTPSARITGDKDRENPVEGARHKPAVTQADVELAEEIGQTMASYYEWGRPSDYQLAKESAAMARDLIARQVEREIVAWLRAENGTCDCFARSEGECACGAWDDYKTKPLCNIADAIEQGQYRSAPS